MPGNVANAAPATVLPWSLCSAFGHAREFLILENEYKNGESQRGLVVSTSRKQWTMTRRLTATDIDTLRDFWEARRGSLSPFYFYDPWDASPKFSYDPTGAQTTGRYTVRFDCPWSQVIGMGRGDIQLTLIELA